MSLSIEYWQALERLKQGSPIRVPKNSKINKDTVALEAGRKRGSIKKSRDSFTELIEAIEQCQEQDQQYTPTAIERLKRERTLKRNYQEFYHQALNRELMLIERLANLEKELEQYKNVISISDHERHPGTRHL